MLEYFKFEVRPFIYHEASGHTSKELHVTVQVNGQEHQITRQIPPFAPAHKTDIRYFTDQAVTMLESKLRDLEEAERQKAKVEPNEQAS